MFNGPDQILIKKQDNFELIVQKDNEIMKLKKALTEY